MSALEIPEGPCSGCKGQRFVAVARLARGVHLRVCALCNGTGYEQPKCPTCTAVHHPQDTVSCEEVQFQWLANEQGLSR